MRIFDWLESEEKVTKRFYLQSYKARGCDCKRQYATKYEAEVALAVYRSQVLFSTMHSYWCKAHSAYHLGHSKRMGKEEIGFRDSMVNMGLPWLNKIIEQKIAS